MTYERSAPYYDLLYEFKDYAAAAVEIRSVIQRYHPQASSMLDVACGTGRHAEHMAASFDVEGLDLNPALLDQAKERCPDSAFHLGDMTAFDLGKKFDVVACLFSSIAYVKTPLQMRAAVGAMADHVASEGLLLLEPWFSPESFWTGTITANFVDKPETKIAWMYTSDEPRDGLVTLDIHYLVGTPAGVEHFEERHELGLFSDAEYRGALEDCGFAVDHDPKGPFGRGLYIAHR